jgi:NADPH2:quinone reductase
VRELSTMTVVRAIDGSLVPATVPPPEAAAGQLLVRVELAGVNYWDVMQRTGAVPLGPGGVPGVEGTGVVLRAGAGAPSELVGRRVAWSKVTGSYAELVAGDAGWFLPVPDAMPAEQAAGLLMQGVTAQYLATATAPMHAGESAVVMAAAGGVGTLLTQLLTEAGVRVVGVIGTAAKAEVARAAGACDVLVDTGDDLVDAVRSVVAGGVRVVFDGNGGPATPRSFGMLAARGWVVLFGTAAGPIPPLDPGLLAAGSHVVTRTAGKHFAGTPSTWRARAEDVLARAEAGRLRVFPDVVLPLSAAAAAHERMESRSSTGKIFLRPSA